MFGLHRWLNFAEFEIRLLNIEPLGSEEAEDSPIRGHLEHVSLLKLPHYHAISYCWGDSSETSTVTIDDQILSIRANLDACLRELRRREVRKVWVDAVCINQNDNYERSQQVSRMSHIYGAAAKVFAWLGNANSESDLAIASLRDYNTVEHAATVLQCFFQRPFWRRMWIIQELAKATDVELLCGRGSVSWDVCLAALQTSEYQKLLSVEQRNLLAGLREFRMRDRQGRPMSLAAALARSTCSMSSEPRDRIYALLGLTSDGSLVVTLPNYTATVDTVFHQAWRRMLIDQQRISTILLARQKKQTARPDIPTWLPDYSSKRERLPPWIIDSIETEYPNSADLDVTMTKSILRLPCKLVGVVESVSGCLSSPKLSSRTRTEIFLCKNELARDRVVAELFNSLTMYSYRYRSPIPDKLESDHHGFSMGAMLVNIALKVEISRNEHRPLFYFASLCLGRQKDAAAPEELKRWIERNGNLLIGDITILELLWSFYKHYRLVPWDSTRSQARDTLAYNALKLGLQRLEEFDMRLVTVRTCSGRLQVMPAFQEARIGDVVLLAPHCSSPLIVRPRADDGRCFSFVGEVYLGPRAQHANNYESMRSLPRRFVRIV